jgi:hypothetical protein
MDADFSTSVPYIPVPKVAVPKVAVPKVAVPKVRKRQKQGQKQSARKRARHIPRKNLRYFFRSGGYTHIGFHGIGKNYAQHKSGN